MQQQVRSSAVNGDFVGRPDNYTTKNDLKEFLQEVGIKNATSRKLISKDGNTVRTSAFRVSRTNIYKDLFYNEEKWPAWTKLRNRIFYKTKYPNLPNNVSN